MPTPIQVGTQIKEIDIFEILPPDEGDINIFYGRIGSGKTMAGTRNVIRELEEGQIVYSNWKIEWEGYDERTNLFKLLLGTLGLKKTFLKFPKENFHFWNFIANEIDGKRCADFTTQLAKLTDCSIHLDEGHIPFDSYEATRMSEQKRSAVFAMRHFDRSLNVYTQRANSVHINLRGNSNRFYKCEKLVDFSLFKKRFIQFQITEFQDLTSSGAVDETRILDQEGNETDEYAKQITQERYWGRKKYFEKYNSKYLRGDMGHSQPNYSELYRLSWKETKENLSHELTERLSTLRRKLRFKKNEKTGNHKLG